MPFHRAASAEEVEEGRCLGVEVGGEKIVLCRVEGRIHAIGDECPHADALLSRGHLEGTTIVCPWHSATFDVRTGDKLSGPAPFGVPRFPVRITDGEIHVETRE